MEFRRRIAEDLSDLLSGEIFTDEVTTALYATDGSIHQMEPVAVVHPRSAQDVEILAAWASDNGVPVIPRGAGTGLAGGAIGHGVVVDFSRHMNAVLEIDRDTVFVQPGAAFTKVCQALRPHGRCLMPPSGRSSVTTIGSMLAVDAAGSQAFRTGSMRDHVCEVECVLIGGQRLLFTRQEPLQLRFVIQEPVSGGGPAGQAAGIPPRDAILPPVRNEALKLSQLPPLRRRDDILERLAAVLDAGADDVRRHQPVMMRNACGYMLRGIRGRRSLDVARLMAGSEGTLGLFTGMRLYTLPLPEHRALTAIMFAGTDDALEAVQQLLDLDPSACDLLDRRLLSVARQTDARWQSVIHQEAEAGLFLEFTGLSPQDVGRRLQEARLRLKASGIRHVVTCTATEPDDVDALWQLPQQVPSLLAKLKSHSCPIPIVEDIAVPPAALSEFLQRARRTFQRHEVTATLYAHAASGQLHLRPLMPLPVPETATRLEALARDLYQHVRAVGGTMTGQGGDGLSRTAFIRSQYGPLYRVFQKVKDIFDPARLLNPDKIISNDGRLTVRYLRPITAAPPDPAASDAGSLLPILDLKWSPDDALGQAVACDGCGECRTVDAGLRMCPLFRIDPDERRSPRSAAAVLRTALTSGRVEELLTHDAVRHLADSCFNCHQCRLECPSNVDIPRLMMEIRAQHIDANGLTRADRLTSRLHVWAALAARFPRLSNRLLGRRLVRRFLERTAGIAEKRRLPRFARRPFLDSPVARRECAGGRYSDREPAVVYFVDYFANYHDTQLAHAFVRIMQHHGYRVFVPPGQTVSGMSMISVGDVEAARQVAETNLRELGEPARERLPIVCTEPTAALCLSREYPLLLDHPDADCVARQTTDAGSFLLDLHRQGKLNTEFQNVPLRLVYHTPCHLKSLEAGQGLLTLLRLIPGIEIHTVDRGCTGMAGTWGIAAEHFDASLKIGSELISELRSVQVNAGATDCSSCRMQMEQCVDFPTAHPLKILALAWGLMPEIASQLRTGPSGYLLS